MKDFISLPVSTYNKHVIINKTTRNNNHNLPTITKQSLTFVEKNLYSKSVSAVVASVG